MVSLNANEWKLENLSLTTENDADFRTDRDYTYGSKIEALFEAKKGSYRSISIVLFGWQYIQRECSRG